MISIKKISADDWRSLRELRLKAVVDSPEAFGDSIEVIENRSEEYWINGINSSDVFISQAIDKWVGMIIFKQDSDGVWSIKSLWVEPDYRKQGIGKMLMEKAIESAKENHVSLIELGVNTESESAINLYKSLGFEIVRTIHDETMADGSLGSLYTMRLIL